MTPFEDEISNDKSKVKEDRLDIPVMKYLWQSGPFGSGSEDNIPKFLRKIEVLKNFSDNELRILSKFLHQRNFSGGEIIFKQGSLGIGLYFILSGQVDIVVERDRFENHEGAEIRENLVITLEKFDYFGELALLQEGSIRNATAYSKENCTVLGIFRPDVDDLIEEYPIVAAKLLQSVAMIVANRLFSLTSEVRRLKAKLSKWEGASDVAKK